MIAGGISGTGATSFPVEFLITLPRYSSLVIRRGGISGIVMIFGYYTATRQHQKEGNQ